MPSTLRRMHDALRHGLVLQSLLNLVARVGVEITPYYLVEESLDWLPAGLPAAEVPDLVMRRLAVADVPALAAMPDGGLTEAEARERLERGVWGLGAWSGGELVAFVWAHLEQLDFAPCRRPLAPDEAYLCGARTRRSYRGRNLSPALRCELYRRLAAEGRTRLLSVSYAFNRPAVRFKRKLGARFSRLYLCTSLWGRCRRNWLLSRPRVG